MRHGMRVLAKWAVRGCILLAAVFLPVALAYAGQPPLWTLGLFLFCTFFCCGILFGNYGTVMPLAYAFLSMSVAAMLVSEGVEWLKRRR